MGEKFDTKAYAQLFYVSGLRGNNIQKQRKAERGQLSGKDMQGQKFSGEMECIVFLFQMNCTIYFLILCLISFLLTNVSLMHQSSPSQVHGRKQAGQQYKAQVRTIKYFQSFCFVSFFFLRLKQNQGQREGGALSIQFCPVSTI